MVTYDDREYANSFEWLAGHDNNLVLALSKELSTDNHSDVVALAFLRSKTIKCINIVSNLNVDSYEYPMTDPAWSVHMQIRTLHGLRVLDTWDYNIDGVADTATYYTKAGRPMYTKTPEDDADAIREMKID